jgi:translation initiation factor IF-2
MTGPGTGTRALRLLRLRGPGLAFTTLLPFAYLVVLSLGGGGSGPTSSPRSGASITGPGSSGGGAPGARRHRELSRPCRRDRAPGPRRGLPRRAGHGPPPGMARHLAAGCAFLPVAAPPLAVGVGLQYSFLPPGSGAPTRGPSGPPGPGGGVRLALPPGDLRRPRRPPGGGGPNTGRDPFQVFLLVTLPVLRRPLVEGFVLGFLVSWAQVPLTLLVGQGVVPALPVEVLSLRAGRAGCPRGHRGAPPGASAPGGHGPCGLRGPGPRGGGRMTERARAARRPSHLRRRDPVRRRPRTGRARGWRDRARGGAGGAARAGGGVGRGEDDAPSGRGRAHAPSRAGGSRSGGARDGAAAGEAGGGLPAPGAGALSAPDGGGERGLSPPDPGGWPREEREARVGRRWRRCVLVY